MKHSKSWKTILRQFREANAAAKSIDELMNRCRKIQTRERLRNDLMLWYMVHALADGSDTEAINRVFGFAKRKNIDVAAILNRPLNGYQPVCRAIYALCPEMLSWLLANGANFNFSNQHGEDIYKTLEEGTRDLIEKDRGNEIFLKFRADKCKEILKNFLWIQSSKPGKKAPSGPKYIPPQMRNNN
jgi:hypothetical protein